jgi:hypothetical protein
MLKEAFPSTARVAFLGMREGWEGSSGQFLREAGSRLGISLVFMYPQKGTRFEIEHVFAAMEQQRPDAVLVSGEGLPTILQAFFYLLHQGLAHRIIFILIICKRPNFPQHGGFLRCL